MEHLDGRVVLDTLRHALTACNLASFSLVDCCQALLGRRMEVLPPSAAARLSGCSARPAQGGFRVFFPHRVLGCRAQDLGPRVAPFRCWPPVSLVQFLMSSYRITVQWSLT